MLRAAWELSSERAESGGETVLRVFHEAIDVPVEPQVELFADDGRFLGRGDLLVTGTCYVHEYDGEHHRGKGQQRTDLRRERGLGGTSYVRRGYVLDDLLNHPLVVMHEIDRAARPSALTCRAGAVASHRGQLPVLRAGSRADHEPLAAAERHRRLVTNRMIRAPISCGW